MIGRAVPNVTDWQYLNLNYVTKARIDQDACIKCGRCYAACEDNLATRPISMSETRVFEVMDDECVACNLCVNVCPVEDCITMERMPAGSVDPRTGRPVSDDYANWTTHPNNPAAREAAEVESSPRFSRVDPPGGSAPPGPPGHILWKDEEGQGARRRVKSVSRRALGPRGSGRGRDRGTAADLHVEIGVMLGQRPDRERSGGAGRHRRMRPARAQRG